MSRTVKRHRMASDIPGESWKIDVFSLCGLGGSFMQNSKKERNPSSCPSSFHGAFLELETDGCSNGTDAELRRGDGIVSEAVR